MVSSRCIPFLPVLILMGTTVCPLGVRVSSVPTRASITAPPALADRPLLNGKGSFDAALCAEEYAISGIGSARDATSISLPTSSDPSKNLGTSFLEYCPSSSTFCRRTRNDACFPGSTCFGFSKIVTSPLPPSRSNPSSVMVFCSHGTEPEFIILTVPVRSSPVL